MNQQNKIELINTLKYASKYGLGVIIPGIVSFLFIPLVVKLFDVAIFAQFSIIQNTINLFVLFSFGWLNQGILRFHSKYKNSDEFIAAVYKLFFFSSLAGIVLSISFLFLFSTSLLNCFLIFLIFLFTGLYSLIISVKQAIVKPITVMIFEIFRTVTLISLPLLFIESNWEGDRLFILLISILLSFLFPVLVEIKWLVRLLVHPVRTNKLKVFSLRLFNYGFPVTVFLGISLALNVSDRFIIAEMLNYDLSGKYAALYDMVSKSVTMACSPILMAFYPAISNNYNNKQFKKVKTLLFSAIVAEIIIFIIIFITLYFWGDLIFDSLFSGKIEHSILKLALPIFFGIALWQLAMLIHKPFELKNKTRNLAFGVGLAFIVNLVANYFFIQKYQSAEPAAYITILSSIVYILYILNSDRKVWKLNT